jgi:hypothetical protein
MGKRRQTETIKSMAEWKKYNSGAAVHPKEVVDAETRIALRQTTALMEQLVAYVDDWVSAPKLADKIVVKNQVDRCKAALKRTYRLLERA